MNRPKNKAATEPATEAQHLAGSHTECPAFVAQCYLERERKCREAIQHARGKEQPPALAPDHSLSANPRISRPRISEPTLFTVSVP